MDMDIAHLAPEERPLTSATLMQLERALRRELRRMIASTHTPRRTPRATAVQQALVGLFGAYRGPKECRLFYLFAARIMREILLQKARAANGASISGLELLALDVPLYRLQALAPVQAQIIDLYYFAGLTAEETALVVGESERTVLCNLRFIRAWLANARIPGREQLQVGGRSGSP